MMTVEDLRAELAVVSRFRSRAVDRARLYMGPCELTRRGLLGLAESWTELEAALERKLSERTGKLSKEARQ